MAANCLDFTSSLISLLEHWSTVLKTYFSQVWRSVHPLAKERDSERLTVGVACDRWQAAPSPTVLAEIADIIEEHGKPRHVRGLAAYLQRGGAIDSDMKTSLLMIADCLVRLGCIHRGSNAYALQADKELKELLAGDLETEDIVCNPDDLFRLLSLEMWTGAQTMQRICILADKLRQAQPMIANDDAPVHRQIPPRDAGRD